VLRHQLEGLPHVVPRLRTHLQAVDPPAPARLLHVLRLHLPVLLQVTLVAQQNQLHVRNRVLVDLPKRVVTSLNQ
jgi:hypothetical protein